MIGTGDFNDDGKTDIVWSDGLGHYSVWLMNASQVLGTSGFQVGTQWSVAATGDYNGDGTSDLLWRDGSGNASMWFFTSGAVSSTGGVGNIAINWKVQNTNS